MSTEEIKALEKGLEFYKQLKGEKDGSVTINVEPIPFAGIVTLTESAPKYREFTDDEIADLIKATNDETGFGHIRIFDFVKVLLKKLQEK